MKNMKFMTVSFMILISALMRFLPHPPNMTPVAAMALFAGASFDRRKAAYLIPFLSLFISDIFLGFHPVMPFVYGSFLLTVVLGRGIKKPGLISVGGASVASSVLFFLITNFGHWAVTLMYPKTMSGLITCYAAGVPFFRNALFGDLMYSAGLFGIFSWAARAYPSLREKPLTA